MMRIQASFCIAGMEVLEVRRQECYDSAVQQEEHSTVGVAVRKRTVQLREEMRTVPVTQAMSLGCHMI